MGVRRALVRAALTVPLAIGLAAGSQRAAAQRAAAESVRATPQTGPLRGFVDSLRKADSMRALEEARTSQLRPPPCLQDSVLGADTALVRACARAYLGYYTYQAEAYAHRSRTFAWQFTSTWVTFVVVVFLVLSGVYFSWLQFRAELPGRAGRRPQVVAQVTEQADVAGSAPQPTGDADAEPAVHTRTVTQLKAGPGGFEVSSPVLGVIILSLSLLFFYLYLKYVYPITETF